MAIRYLGKGTGQQAVSLTSSPPSPAAGVFDVGDLLLVVAHYYGASTITLSVTSGSNWTEIGTNTASTTYGTLAIFWKLATGSTESTPTISASGGTATKLVTQMFAFTGVNQTTPIDVAGSKKNHAAPTTPFTYTGDVISIATAGAMVMFAAGSRDDNTWSGWAGGIDAGQTLAGATGTPDGSITLGYKANPDAQATGNCTAPTANQSALGGDAGQSLTFALRPGPKSGAMEASHSTVTCTDDFEGTVTPGARAYDETMAGSHGTATPDASFATDSNTIIYPAHAETVPQPVTFTGTSFPGATVELWDMNEAVDSASTAPGFDVEGTVTEAGNANTYNESLDGSHQTVTVGTDGFSVALSNQLAAQIDGDQCSVTVGTSGFAVEGTVTPRGNAYNETVSGDQSTVTPGDSASAARRSAVAWPEGSVNATDSLAPARRTDLSFPEESVNPTESVSEDRKTNLTLPQESVNTTDSADAARKTDLTMGGDQSTVTATESVNEDRLTGVTITGDQITVTTDDSTSAARKTDLAVSEAQVTTTTEVEGTVAKGGSAYNEGIDGVHQTVTATEQTGAARRTDALVDGSHNTTSATDQATATRQTNVTMGGDQSTATPTDQVSEDRNTNVTLAGAESTITATDQYAEDRRTTGDVTGSQTTVTVSDQTSAARRTNVTLPEESTAPSDSVAMLRKQSAGVLEQVTPSVDQIVGKKTDNRFTGDDGDDNRVDTQSSQTPVVRKASPGEVSETVTPDFFVEPISKRPAELSEQVTPSEIVDGLVNQDGRIWNEWWGETVTTDFSTDALVIRTGVLTESSNVQSTSDGSLSIPVTVAGTQTTATTSENVTAQKLLPGTLTETLPQPNDAHAAARRSAAALSESTQPTDTADVRGKFLNSLSEQVTPSEIVDGNVNQSGAIWNEGWPETVTATDYVEGSDIGVYEGYLSESVTLTEQVTVTRKTGQDLTETVTATDTCAATIKRNVDVSESVTPDTTVVAVGFIDASVTETVNTQDQQDYVHLLGVGLGESVTTSDSTDLLGNFVNGLTATAQPGDVVDTDAVTEVFNEGLVETVHADVYLDTPYIPPGIVHTGILSEYVTATDTLEYTHRRPVEPPVVVIPDPDVTYRVTMLDSESHNATVSDLTTHRVIVITEE